MCHLCATLENLTLSFRFCLSLISQCLLDQNSNPICKSLGCVLYQNLKRRIDSRSNFLISSSLVRFRHHKLFSCLSLTLSSTWRSPLITCAITFSQHVCESVFGVNVFDLDVEVQIVSVQKSIESNSVGSGHVSHRGTSAVYDHFDHCFIVFKNEQLSFESRRFSAFVTT